MNDLLFHGQICSSLTPIPQLTLFKIYGSQHFSFEQAHYESKVDWSGFYTQLNPEHSLRYLTKKWDDGAQTACLITIFATNLNLRLLTVEHQALSNFKIPGEVKAHNIKMHLKEKYQEFKDIQGHKLIKYLGEHHILMSCVDSEDKQIIIPHELLNQEHFRFENIASFKRSNDGMLRTIGFKKADVWKKVPSEVQFEPYLLLKQQIWNEQQLGNSS